MLHKFTNKKLAGIALTITLLAGVFGLFTRRDLAAFVLPGRSVNFEGRIRTYRSSKPGKEVESIIIGLHGFGDSSRQFAYYTSLHNLADNSTLVVYPDAVKPASDDIKTGWNASFCCGSGWVGEVDDVAYLAFLIQTLKEKHSAPFANVFLTGFSNGAFMAQRFAVERPELVDGVAVSAGTIGTTRARLEPSQPVPILLMHGEQDNRVAFDGGASDGDPDFVWLAFEETKRTWEEVNGDRAATKAIVYPDNKHVWDDWRLFNVWNKKPDASAEVVRFFSNIAKP